ncbi:hypothetical protein OEIGOIKO_00566 [Streptomyces chrestomyceticus JCM 4735]|uniref:Uncharacterized protein n=1 Tax=Streptomyces chrestomyceticus JCM 4735 TaxID=1306181 RepID=A0A7U9KQD2_9ACTN|nr:hypothetical protein OEIGOIKO_00566 [Streptomyces chrestomyceticus JCM 4735]
MRNLQLCFFAGSGNLKTAVLLGSQRKQRKGMFHECHTPKIIRAGCRRYGGAL